MNISNTRNAGPLRGSLDRGDVETSVRFAQGLAGHGNILMWLGQTDGAIAE